MNRFTRTDLAAVAGTLGMLGLLAFPRLTSSNSVGDEVFCANNMRRLIGAWQTFAVDNNERLPATYHGGIASSPMPISEQFIPWAQGWMTWDVSAHNTNIQYLIDPKYSVIAPYHGGSKEIFKCPADKYVSNTQVARRWPERVRSVSANVCLGDGSNGPTGPWNPSFATVSRLSQFVRPSPANTYVFIEEHPDSINDPAFWSPSGGGNSFQWVDLPANYHNGASALSFADGRVEHHRWTGPLRTLAIRYNFTLPPPSTPPTDLRYLYERTPLRP